MSNVSRDEADRVLRLKSREREAHACYPCRKRKVKCDGNQPCQTCVRRKHPSICTYGVGAQSTRRSASRQAASNTQAALSPNPARSVNESIAEPQIQHDTSIQRDESSKNYVFSGDRSVVSILRSRASDANDSVVRDVGSVLGLQNTFNNYPFMDSKTPAEKWKSLLGVLPQRAEILKFFHYYQVTAYPYNPILADMSRFETDLCSYLDAHASGDFRDPETISYRWATEKSIGYISLLLATLAAGAHYSDVDYPQRLELATDFARRSFHALRLANFLFRPSLDIIQALLILGNTLQNMGQSDAAWALLGTTVRLAQTMGLHTERSTIHWPEYVRGKARTLWSTIVWQDSLLCLCYDRPPIVSVTGWPLDNTTFERRDLSYPETMHLICRLGLDIMGPEAIGFAEFDRAIEGLQRLDSVCRCSREYLQNREKCMTLQQNLERLALRMHTSFCVSVLCRPAMRQSQPQSTHSNFTELSNRAKASLIDASKAFLDFQALSIVPLRSWSMVHTVLSSTLLLCIWEETRHDPECRNLQQRVIDVFTSADSKLSDDGGAVSDTEAQWLSARHIRALISLRSTLDKERDNAANETQDFSIEPQFPFGVGNLDGYIDMGNPFDTSPVSYLDSIMNVPLFDFTQENGFL